MNQPRIIRKAEVLNRTGLSASSIYYLEKKGAFPSHFMLTPKCAVWHAHEVDQWIDSRVATPVTPAPPPDPSLRKTIPGKGKRVRA